MPLLERALALAEASPDSAVVGAIRFALARAELARGSHARAKEQARAAMAALKDAGFDGTDARTELAAWMKRRGPDTGNSAIDPRAQQLDVVGANGERVVTLDRVERLGREDVRPEEEIEVGVVDREHLLIGEPARVCRDAP